MPWLKNDEAWGDLDLVDRLRKRFLAFCTLPYGVLGCWLFRGETQYPGRFSMSELDHGRLWKPARAAWHLFIGEIPPDTDVLHNCDVPPCCNVLHMRLGRDAQNVQDRIIRGRGRGRWSQSKVTYEPWSDRDFLLRYVDHPGQLAAVIDAIRGALPDLPCNAAAPDALRERER